MGLGLIFSQVIFLLALLNRYGIGPILRFSIFTIGVHEQSYIAHAIEYAAGWHDQDITSSSPGVIDHNAKILCIVSLVQFFRLL